MNSSTKPRKPKAAPEPQPVELDPDAWPKFEALVKSAAKMGHKPHAPSRPKPASRKARKPA
jgi:hypothetical protein